MAKRTCNEVLAVHGDLKKQRRYCAQPPFGNTEKCYYHLRMKQRADDAARREKKNAQRHPPMEERKRSRRLA